MSASQILYKSPQSYSEQATKQLIHASNQSYLFSHYRAGEKPDFDKSIHALMLKKTTESNNCELLEFVVSKIEGKLEPCEKKRCLSDLVDEYRKCFKKVDCTDSEIICDNIGLVQF